MKTIQGRLGLPKRLGIAAAVFLICVLSTSAQLRALREAPNPSEPGTFYLQSDLDENPVPWPFNPYPPDVVPVFAIDAANNVFLVADSPEAFSALQQQKQMPTALSSGGMMTMDESDLGPPGPGGDTNGYGGYTNNFVSCPFDTNALWLELADTAPGLASVHLHNGTNQVYGIWGSTDLQTWNVEMDLWPTNSSVMPFTVPMLNRQTLFLRAQDWTGVWMTNGLPMWWAWENFGDGYLSETASGDYDQDNVSNLQEYEAGTEPNKISFSINPVSQYVNVDPTLLQISLAAGVPSTMAVLVDDTNVAGATWTFYTSSPAANLGSEGWHEIWIGLRGRLQTSQQTWHRCRLKLDITAPVLVITNPALSTISEPITQIQGYCLEPLVNFTYDVVNSNGVTTNLPALITGQDYDTNVWDNTTNYFQTLDVPLCVGTNTVTLYATDRAGNTTVTNLLLTLDYSSKTNPPTIQLIWPQDGTQIGSTNFACRGRVSDSTAVVSAQVVDSSGVTNSAVGRVSRNGYFWIDNLPVSASENSLTVMARDVVGNSARIDATVTGSSVALTIDPSVAQNWIVQLGSGSQVFGTITDPTYTIAVNGVPGTNNGDGTWVACLPLTLDDTVLHVQATPPGGNNQFMRQNSMFAAQDNNSGSPSLEAEMALEWPFTIYENLVHEVVNLVVKGEDHRNHWNLTWTDKGGGSGMSTGDIWWGGGPPNSSYAWPGGGWPYLPDGILISDGSTNSLDPPGQGWDRDYGYYDYTSPDGTNHLENTEHIEQILVTGGKPGSTDVALYQLAVGGGERVSTGPEPFGVGRLIPCESITVAMGGLGNVDSQGNLFFAAADHTRVNITPQISGANYTSIGLNGIRYDLKSQTYAMIPADRSRTNLGVGEVVTMYFSPPLPTNGYWKASSGYIVYPYGPWTYFYAPSNAASVTVTFQLQKAVLTKTFKVVEPDGIDHADFVEYWNYSSTNLAGAGMHLRPFIGPTNVSFYRVQVEEVGEDASNLSGYFTTNNAPSHKGHGADAWITLDYDNHWKGAYDGQYDWVESAGWSPPWYGTNFAGGSYTWDIPAKWKILGDTNEHTMTGWDQVHILSANGTMTVTKFTKSVSRTIQNIYSGP